MSDEDPPDNVTRMDIPRKRTYRPRRKANSAEEKKKAVVIPVLPPLEIDLAGIEDFEGHPNLREIATVNMRVNGAPFHEIAKALEYPNAGEAKRAYIRAVAATHPVEDWETLRHLEATRAEQLFRRSFAMASADFLVDSDTGERIPNTEKLRWHERAAADLMLHATITGAKAPARLEVTPDEAGLDDLVSRILRAQGHEDEMELQVVELEELPAAPLTREGDEPDA